MFSLRPYQAEAKQAILSAWDEGHRKTLLVLPTGCGKTVVFSSVTEEQVGKGHRVLIMAHRGELLEQAAQKLKDASGLDTVLEKAESSSLGSFIPVTVGSVQSLCQPSRLSRFPENYYQDIIVDEAHHCLSDSYRRVLDHFPEANVLGVTAAPDRGDMKNLGEFFDSRAYEYSMSAAIKDGYLCPIKAQMIPLELDITSVKMSSGDFAAGEIGSALEPYLHQIADEMVHYCEGRKTVVFLPLIATSQRFCRMLNDRGLRAAEVNGNSEDRSEILADFEAGKYDVLCNSMLLTEGWDCPAVDCIVVLRPTKVRSLYQQMVGRGMRLSPGKDHLLLLDFLWMTERHDLCRPSALISKDAKIAELSNCEWIRNHRNVLLTGASGAGKSWIASALGVAACNAFFSVRYVRLPEMLDELTVDKDEDWLKTKKRYLKCDLLILDDWLLEKIGGKQARELLEIVEGRLRTGSLLICSQFSPAGWHAKLGEGAIADAVIDRIVYRSDIIHIEGDESMRKRIG